MKKDTLTELEIVILELLANEDWLTATQVEDKLPAEVLARSGITVRLALEMLGYKKLVKRRRITDTYFGFVRQYHTNEVKA